MKDARPFCQQPPHPQDTGDQGCCLSRGPASAVRAGKGRAQARGSLLGLFSSTMGWGWGRLNPLLSEVLGVAPGDQGEFCVG